MGSRALGRTKDLEIGSKLTDGCVWAYDSMRSGIMPEVFKVLPCADKKNCVFSRDEWLSALEPPIIHSNRPKAGSLPKLIDATPAPVVPEDAGAPETPVVGVHVIPDDEAPVHGPAKRSVKPLRTEAEARRAREYALDVVANEDLPEGFLGVGDKRYILRPEAVESVWYMYRISAESEWMEKGWRMWENVIRAVGVDGHGKGPASAIADVTLDPENIDFDWLNSMESFWFGGNLPGGERERGGS